MVALSWAPLTFHLRVLCQFAAHEFVHRHAGSEGLVLIAQGWKLDMAPPHRSLSVRVYIGTISHHFRVDALLPKTHSVLQGEIQSAGAGCIKTTMLSVVKVMSYDSCYNIPSLIWASLGNGASGLHSNNQNANICIKPFKYI